MPELSGLLVLREMPNSHELCEVRMLTGRQGRGGVELATYECPSDYMKKPFDPDGLIFRIEELLASMARQARYLPG